ncbi:thiamine phosphate synthase [Sideroxydans lithotrophicus]|uniref:Thiamine-phosphate synthase n=1 Tax=Sideroxydans lithotrophicus (strain ES-1) TaxID=580332 RepID=D5CTH6_SIDLE|nr:thiamine phosphate synthase [Sideroxydans lithotrophicus]ADE10282.1 thiamine-phosphate pyrophosphorylase [Sideroxydans lithotrophicus ES-1]
MKQHQHITGLYAITPDILDTDELLRSVRLALRGGAHVLQYRNKAADTALKLAQAHALRQLTREFGAIFIVNDDAGLAAQVDADGVHLGGEDGSVVAARALLGDSRIVGVSCYNRFPLAHEAVRLGADYVAFGAFFSSSVKPEAVQADVALLRSARKELNVPIVAIGGITQQNAATLIEAGADAVAVISALWNAPDIEASAHGFSTLFSRT